MKLLVTHNEMKSHEIGWHFAEAFERSSPQRRSVRRSHTTSEETETQRSRLAKPSGANASNADIKMMVVWLESFEDHLNFPTGSPHFIHIFLAFLFLSFLGFVFLETRRFTPACPLI